MEDVELTVTPMTCGSCVASVTRALKRVPGVLDVHADLRNGTVRVSGEQVTHRGAAMLAALKEAGYEGSPVQAARASRGNQTQGCTPDAQVGTKRGGGCCCR